MTAQVSEQDIERIEASIIEMKRLRTLSNEELVREYLRLNEQDTELHINEMLTRLHPNWAEESL